VPPSCIIDSSAQVIVDTSAVINLTASGYAKDILGAIPNRFLVVDAVPAELDEGRNTGRLHADLVDELVSLRHLKIVSLGNQATQVFEELVFGKGIDTLDDGEAATIAYAVESAAFAIIDERKANRICNQRFPSLRMGCSMDIFSHPNVLHAIGRKKQADAVFKALRDARMRVLPHHEEWVVNLIGPEQAKLCPSLPKTVRCAKLDRTLSSLPF